MFRDRMGRFRLGWTIAFVFILVFIFQGIFSGLATTLLFAINAPSIDVFFQSEPFTKSDDYPMNSLLVYGGAEIGIILAVLLVWRYLHKHTLRELGFSWSGRDAIFGFLLGALSITAMFLILLLTGLVELTNNLLSPMFSSYTLITLLFFIIVGISEEVLFRGYIMSFMNERGISKWLVYMISAALFAAMHGLNPNLNLLGLVNIFLVGLLFAYMFDARKNLWLPIGYHIAWNYFQGSVYGFAVSGTEPRGLYEATVRDGYGFVTGGAFGLEGGILTSFILLVGYAVTKVYIRKGRLSKPDDT